MKRNIATNLPRPAAETSARGPTPGFAISFPEILGRDHLISLERFRVVEAGNRQGART